MEETTTKTTDTTQIHINDRIEIELKMWNNNELVRK